ncbi:MAG: glycerophosphodiester phosphodiesterase [Candidatus Levybacteria bacterium]|nr:glycerophosphodiester phosphodiesterase [Candidatus Levybacteria bacterium]
MNSRLHKTPLFISHRGNTVSFPENTLEAFLSAFEKRADGVELDVHLHNGEIIVVNNFLFDRNKKYPSLKDILKKIHSKGRIEIEIKEFDTKILQQLKEILNNFPQTDLELTTSEIPLAPYIKDAFPKIPLGVIFHDFFFQEWMTPELVQQKLIGWGKLAKANRLHISLKILEQFGQGILVDKLHSAGFVVHSHVFNTEERNNDFKKISEWDIDQCTFDSIDILNLRNT